MGLFQQKPCKRARQSRYVVLRMQQTVHKWNIDHTAFKKQQARAKEICDGLYNAPWIGSSRVICNADPKFYWGTSDCDMTPDNEGPNLCWQCQPGEHCRK